MKQLVLLTLTMLAMSAGAQTTEDIRRIMSPQSDMYKVLGISQEASQDQIKAAYKRIIREFHPDRYENNPTRRKVATEVVKRANAARDLLTGPGKSYYDLSLKPQVRKWQPPELSTPAPEAAKGPVRPAGEAPAEKSSARSSQAQEAPKASEPPKNEVVRSSSREAPPREAEIKKVSDPTYTGRTAQRVYGDVKKCGAGYFQSFVDIML